LERRTDPQQALGADSRLFRSGKIPPIPIWRAALAAPGNVSLKQRTKPKNPQCSDSFRSWSRPDREFPFRALRRGKQATFL
jgi:hypothetical protein